MMEYFSIRNDDNNIVELGMNGSGALLPSHGLPPFGANITNITMGEGLCGSSMFGGDRWGVNSMTAGKCVFVWCEYTVINYGMLCDEGRKGCEVKVGVNLRQMGLDNVNK